MTTYRKDPVAVARLTGEQYRVTQHAATEAPGTGINSAALRFVHRDDMQAAGYAAYLGLVKDVHE